MFNLIKPDNIEAQKEYVSDAVTIISDRLKTTGDAKTDQAIDWIKGVLESTIRLSNDVELELDPPESQTFPKEISAFIIQTMIRLLTGRSDLNDNGLYYLNDTGAALSIKPQQMRNLIDEELNKLRYEFTVQLKKELDIEQLQWCALILLKMIYADGQVHPEEKLYFDIVNELVKEGSVDLEQLKLDAQITNELPRISLSPESARSMLKYVVTIAMCDGEYVGQESDFIQKVAVSLGIESSNIDSILQPVASSFMVLESLFPKV